MVEYPKSVAGSVVVAAPLRLPYQIHNCGLSCAHLFAATESGEFTMFAQVGMGFDVEAAFCILFNMALAATGTFIGLLGTCFGLCKDRTLKRASLWLAVAACTIGVLCFLSTLGLFVPLFKVPSPWWFGFVTISAAILSFVSFFLTSDY